jgi:hypothetical protein
MYKTKLELYFNFYICYMGIKPIRGDKALRESVWEAILDVSLNKGFIGGEF